MLLVHARAGSRIDPDGRLVPFEEQDRGGWNGELIEQAQNLLSTTGAGPLGPYQVEAAIALLHRTGADSGEMSV